MRRFRASRKLSFEVVEARRLLAVDLVIEVQEEPVEVADRAIRTVRVYNNGEETAHDAVVRASFPDMDDVTWERQSGFARFVHTTPADFGDPDFYLRGNIPRAVLNRRCKQRWC